MLIAVPYTESLVSGPVRRDPLGKESGEQTQEHKGSHWNLKEGASAKPLSFRIWFTCCPGKDMSVDEI